MAILRTKTGLYILCVWLDGECIPISIPTDDHQYLVNAARSMGLEPRRL